MTVTNSNSRNGLGVNQQIYQRLKAALGLNLRRQIFVAVCDDLALRNLLAAKLHADLAYPNNGTKPAGQERYPQLVSLNLDLNDPDPVAQCALWLQRHPPPKQLGQPRIPGFQILGVERLTRQIPTVQRLFLSNLQRIEHTLPTLEASLVLWMPRPWCRTIQQSAPEFWRWHTGVFEFEGDPTPAPAGTKGGSSQPSAKAPANQGTVNKAGVKPPSGSDRPPAHSATPNAGKAGVSGTTATNGVQPAKGKGGVEEPLAPPKENVWDILNEDLSRLDEQGSDANQATQQPSNNRTPASSLPQNTQTASPGKSPQTTRPDDRQKAKPPSTSSNPKTPTAKTTASKSSSPSTPRPTTEVASPTNPSTAQVPLTQSQSALELADFVLASIAQEMGENSKLGGTALQSADTSSEASATQGKLQPIQVLEHIEQLHLQQAPSAALATAYRTLGNLYRDRIEKGGASQQNILISIRAYEQTLSWLDETSSLCSDILNDIGNLYWMLSHTPTQGDQALAYLEQGIQAYQKALSKTNPETRPHSYAMIQNNLGSAYGDMARYRDAVENLQQSILAYEEALRYRDTKADPQRFAATKNNLGTAYWNLAQYEKPIVNLSQAIVAYNEALQYYEPEREPLSFAMIQNNIGTAYWNLAQFDQNALDQSLGTSLGAAPEDLLQLAIGAYRVALVFRTQETVPAAYAATQNNLGTAYWHLANQPTVHFDDRREYLKQAITAYQSALEVAHQLLAQSVALSFDFLATHNNLGLALYQLATDKHSEWDKTTQLAYLEQALHHHLQALQGWESKPDFYQSAFGYVVQTIRTCYSEHGISGQNLALSKVPGQLLPEILKRL
jgi:tetratricopeptide (TPR) repeat protein